MIIKKKYIYSHINFYSTLKTEEYALSQWKNKIFKRTRDEMGIARTDEANSTGKKEAVVEVS